VGLPEGVETIGYIRAGISTSIIAKITTILHAGFDDIVEIMSEVENYAKG